MIWGGFILRLDVIYGGSYYNKVNPSNYVASFEEVIDGRTNDAMDLCMTECPVDTGNLRDSHDVDVDGLTGRVTNSAEYWVYVVYGTYKMSANNYPVRVSNQLKSIGIEDRLNTALRNNGIL